jgi:hypothetical protein
MDTANTAAELFKAIIEQRAEWDQMLGGLSDQQMVQPNVCGHWSVKDVIAHISWFEQQMEWMVTHHSLATPQGELWYLPTDERNEVIYQQYKDKSLPELMELAQSRYLRMLAAIKLLEDEDLTDASRYEGMPAEWLPADIIAQNTWQHYADHLVGIKSKFGM